MPAKKRASKPATKKKTATRTKRMPNAVFKKPLTPTGPLSEVVGAKAIRLLKASATRWIDRACGGVLLALAGSLAFYRRANS